MSYKRPPGPTVPADWEKVCAPFRSRDGEKRWTEVCRRLWVPGGWFVLESVYNAGCFVPDPEH